MKDYRGMYIQQMRKEKEYSLEALSHGICSVSYLSKIENGEVCASDEILNLLLKKLNVKIIEDTNLEDVKQQLNSFFELLFEYDVRIYDVVYQLKAYDGKLLGSSLFIDYELFKMYAKEACETEFKSSVNLGDYIQFMDDKQKGLYAIYQTWSSQDGIARINKNIELFLLKGQAGKELKRKNVFKSYDLLKSAYTIALEKCNLICVCDILLAMAWTGFPDISKIEECYSQVLDIANKYFKSKVKNQYETLIYYNHSLFLLMNKNYVEAEKKFKLGYKKLKYMDEEMKRRFIERYAFCEMKLGKDTKFLLEDIPQYLKDEDNIYNHLKTELKKRDNDIFIHYLFKEACVKTSHWKEAYEQECYFSQKRYIE